MRARRKRFSLRPSDHVNLAAFAQTVRGNDPPAPLWYKVFVSYVVFFCEWFAIIFCILICIGLVFG